MEQQISNILNGAVNSPFETYYATAKTLFSTKGHFHELSGNTCKSLQWPTNPGVYVVWKRSSPEEVLYIGMTGKFSQAGVLSSSTGLKHRVTRWTPYCFDKTANTFCFGPLPVQGNNSLKKQQAAGYRHNVSISQIRVDCFEYFDTHKMAPAFLESLLLQGYLMEYGILPAANNEL